MGWPEICMIVWITIKLMSWSVGDDTLRATRGERFLGSVIEAGIIITLLSFGGFW